MEKYQILRDQANQRCKYLISIDENNLLLMAILLYPPFKASFLTNLARLEIAKLIQSGQTTSVTMNKKIMKQTLAHVFYIFNLRCSVQAASLNNTELKKFFDVKESYIGKANDSDAITYAKAFLKKMTDNNAILTIIDPSNLTTMQDAIDAFENIMNMPRIIRKQAKSEGTDVIDDIQNDINEDKNNIGKIIHSYELTFAHQWDVDSVIGKPSGTRNTSIVIQFKSAIGETHLKGVICTITSGSETHTLKSTKEGYVRFYSLPNNVWNMTSVHPDYENFSQTNITTDDTKIIRLTCKLIKK